MRWFVLAALLALALIGPAGVAGAQPRAQLQASCLSLTPTGGPGGASVGVAGAGRAPGSSVSISIGSLVLGTAVADDTGSFSTHVTIPIDLTPGVSTITASGGPAGCQGAAAFHLVEAPGLDPAPSGPLAVNGLWDIGAAAVILASAFVLAVRRRQAAGARPPAPTSRRPEP